MRARGFVALPWLQLFGWVLAALAAAAFVYGIYAAVRNHFYAERDAYWRPRIEALEVDLAARTKERDDWKAVSERCSAATAELQRRAALARAEAERLREQAAKASQAYRAEVKRLEELLAKPTPPGAGCDAAWDAIRDSITRTGLS